VFTLNGCLIELRSEATLQFVCHPASLFIQDGIPFQINWLESAVGSNTATFMFHVSFFRRRIETLKSDLKHAGTRQTLLHPVTH
jgi:hypothetical protein